MESKSNTTPSADQTRFRQALGSFATGVTIVTTEHDGQVHGMTANGFMSVSLDPPLVVVSIAHQARMHELLEASGSYGVSVLAQTQAQLSSHFAGKPEEGATIPFVAEAGVPLIEGAIAQVAAKICDAHPAGDHTLFIGEVLHFDWRDGQPLIFHSGGYRELLSRRADPTYSGAWSDFCLEPLGPHTLDP
jgi:flavin reductase (DIM6/NTAB) family NADH-FMN oxidoreductase RutF